MKTFHLHLFTNRSMVLAFLEQLRPIAHHPWQINCQPIAAEAPAALVEGLPEPAIVAIDVVPEPVAALQLCHGLARQFPGVPLVGLVCCHRQIALSHLQALLAAGISSLLELCLTPEEMLRALERIARGHTIIQLSLRMSNTPGSLLAELVGSRREVESSSVFSPLLQSESARLLELVARGLSDQEIGTGLCLSASAVHHRLQRLCQTIGARNRIELAAWAGMWGFYQPCLD